MATPEEVWAKLMDDVPDDAALTAAIVLVEYSRPESDGRYLHFMKDSQTSSWTHYGMLSALRNDIAAALVAEGQDDA